VLLLGVSAVTDALIEKLVEVEIVLDQERDGGRLPKDKMVSSQKSSKNERKFTW
jgi:hypothetical protein